MWLVVVHSWLIRPVQLQAVLQFNDFKKENKKQNNNPLKHILKTNALVHAQVLAFRCGGV